MRELAGRLLAVLAVVTLVALGAAAPTAAQTEPPPIEPDEDGEPDRWAGSSFSSPVAGAIHEQPEVRVAGRFTYQKETPGQRIVAATIEVVPDGFEPAPTCEVPPSQAVPGGPPTSSDYDMDQPATLAFDVSGLRVTCNGPYLVRATAQLDDGTRWPMEVRFGVAVAPPQVEQVTATLDAAAKTATVTFTPLPLEARAPDAAGYRVERAGPDDDAFTEIATVPDDAEPTFVDDLGAAEPGAYLYRVRPLRRGVDEPVASDPSAAPTAEVVLDGEPTSPTTVIEEPEERPRSGGSSVGRSRRGPGRSVARRTTGAARPTTSTTLDTGFDDTLDYGDRGEGELAGDEPVAGQSIVQDEAEGMGLAVPAAGALVMLGWAGHILYLNRLAKQL